MTLRRAFVAGLWERSSGRGTGATPSEMCEEACRLVGARGAGIVMAQRLLRRPVGASDDDSRRAEEIQASLGDGPCLTADASGDIVVVSEPEMATRWPVYHAELVRSTPFRATMSFPMARGGRNFGALNFYSVRPSWALREDPEEIQHEIVDLVGLLLLTDVAVEGGPPSTWGQSWAGRERVWMAAGRLMQSEGVSDSDAMALLRAYAFGRELSIEDLAAALAAGHLTTRDVMCPDD